MEKAEVTTQTIGDIGNYYGRLTVKTENGKCYWSIEDWDGFDWREIPQRLYDELLAFDKSVEESTK